MLILQSCVTEESLWPSPPSQTVLFLFSLIVMMSAALASLAIDIRLHTLITLITHTWRGSCCGEKSRINMNMAYPVKSADCLCLLYFIKMIK